MGPLDDLGTDNYFTGDKHRNIIVILPAFFSLSDGVLPVFGSLGSWS